MLHVCVEKERTAAGRQEVRASRIGSFEAPFLGGDGWDPQINFEGESHTCTGSGTPTGFMIHVSIGRDIAHLPLQERGAGRFARKRVFVGCGFHGR